MRRWLVAVALTACSNSEPPEPESKVYVAVEHDEAIVVLDGRDLRLRRTIVVGHHAFVHNVQVAPDGRSVWATVVGMHEGSSDHDDGPPQPDRVVVIDPVTDKIATTIDLGLHVHPAHVVLTPDSRTALVTATETNELIRIDAVARTIVGRIPLGHGAEPHGLRLSPDGRFAWVAKLGGCVERVDWATGETAHTLVDGSAVQAGVAGRFVFASLYSTRKVVRLDTTNGDVRYIDLPMAAQGPVQVYPTPDHRVLLVADQGGLEGRPWSNQLFFVDVEGAFVDSSMTVGSGAHGVVVHDGRAFVTGLNDGTVSAVDLASRRVTHTAKVGRAPNGISVWVAPR
jgi:YVTN family beta-propeller protein